jgi:hypothetical protein
MVTYHESILLKRILRRRRTSFPSYDMDNALKKHNADKKAFRLMTLFLYPIPTLPEKIPEKKSPALVENGICWES